MDSQHSTRIEFSRNDKGVYYKFTDIPFGEEWTPDRPVSYEICILFSELWPIVDDAVRQLQKSPARRTLWQSVKAAFKS